MQMHPKVSDDDEITRVNLSPLICTDLNAYEVASWPMKIFKVFKVFSV